MESSPRRNICTGAAGKGGASVAVEVARGKVGAIIGGDVGGTADEGSPKAGGVPAVLSSTAVSSISSCVTSAFAEGTFSPWLPVGVNMLTPWASRVNAMAVGINSAGKGVGRSEPLRPAHPTRTLISPNAKNRIAAGFKLSRISQVVNFAVFGHQIAHVGCRVDL